MKIKYSYLGLVIGLIFAASVYFWGRPNTLTDVFLSTTNVLFWFYIAAFIINVTMMVVGRALFWAITSTILRRKGVPPENLPLLGFRSFVKSIVWLVVFSGCLIGGVYLLNHALVNLEWDKLAAGGALLLVGLIREGSYIGFIGFKLS